MLFRNDVHRDIWIEHHCERCARHPGCQIIVKAITSDRKPVQWQRNPRKNALMADTIKCNEEVRKLPTKPRTVVDDTLPMFDVTPIPKRQEVDHD